MHTARSGDRNVVGGDRGLPDRGYGFKRRGDRWLPDRWLGPGAPGSGGGVTPPPVVDPILTIWPDSSGHGRTGTAVGSPLFETNVLNALPVVRFRSASSDGFNFPAITMIRPSCVVAVMKRAGVNKILYALAGNGAAGIPIDLIDADGGFYSSNANGEYTHWSPPITDLTVWHVVTFHDADSSYPRLYIDGTDILFQTAGAGGGNQWLNIGYNAIQAVFSDGDLADMAIYNGVNRNTDVIGGESYFGNKYGIATTSNGNPQVIPSQAGLIAAWWSASALWTPSHLNDGDTVNEWPDVSGNGHHGEKTGNPILKKNIVGGKPVVRLRSASLDGFNLLTPISSVGDWTAFIVAKPLTPASVLMGLASNNSTSPYTYLNGNDGLSCFAFNRTGYISAGPANDAFHVVTADFQTGVLTNIYKDGTSITGGFTFLSSTNDFKTIGYMLDGSFWSDGDMAEIILYQGALALRVKLVLLITTLLTTGEFPSPAEFNHIVGHRHRIRRYLHLHGANPTQAQLDAVVTPMAAGDRSNIEKTLSVKYSTPAPPSGTVIDPYSIPGMMAWYKADSL